MTNTERMGARDERTFRTANEVAEDDFVEQAARIGRHFWVTEFSHPALCEAFDLVTYDSGGGPGHVRFPVPVRYSARALAADRALRRLQDDGRFDSVVIGDEDDMLAWADEHPDNAAAHELLNLFFEGWHDDFPGQTVTYPEPNTGPAFANVTSAARSLLEATPPADELAAARLIATAAIEDYGDLDEHEWARFRERGIWNDHAAVQAALAAIRITRESLVRPVVAAPPNGLELLDCLAETTRAHPLAFMPDFQLEEERRMGNDLAGPLLRARAALRVARGE